MQMLAGFSLHTLVLAGQGDGFGEEIEEAGPSVPDSPGLPPPSLDVTRALASSVSGKPRLLFMPVESLCSCGYIVSLLLSLCEHMAGNGWSMVAPPGLLPCRPASVRQRTGR